MDYKKISERTLRCIKELETHLHLGDIGIGRGLAAVLLGNAGLLLAKVLAGGVEGGRRHDDRVSDVGEA